MTDAFTLLTQKCIKKFGKMSSESERNNAVEDIRKKKEEFKLKSGKQ